MNILWAEFFDKSYEFLFWNQREILILWVAMFL